MRNMQRLLVFPAWEDNPYINLLNLAARAYGYQQLGATTHPTLLKRLDGLSSGDVFQLHWTQAISQTAPSAEAARARLRTFTRALERAQQRGAKIVWTIHNRLPHELRFHDVEVGLLRTLAARADAIHVMSSGTTAFMADICELPPDRVHVIPHPSYLGVYGPPTTDERRTDARAALGVSPDQYAVLAFGQIRGYKGLDVLIAAMTRLADEGMPVKLLIAGSAKEDMRSAIGALIPDDLPAVVSFDFVDDSEVHRWFDAADVAVFPYRAILNSGSTHLAATFGVPVVLPGEPHLREQFRTHPWVRFYGPAEGASSLSAVLRERPRREEYLREMEDFATTVSPWHISQQYLRLLQGLSRPAVPAATLESAPMDGVIE